MAQVRRDRQVTDEAHAAAMFTAFARASVIFAVFTAIVLATLFVNSAAWDRADPRNSRVLKTLKADLRKHPRDEKIKAKIRDLDLRLRIEYTHRTDFARTGGYVLLFGIVGLLLTVPAAAAYRGRLRLPETGTVVDHQRLSQMGRRSVTGFGALALGGFMVLVALSSHDPTRRYLAAVREYEKNPLPSLRTPIADPLAGLPPAMLQNLVGRRQAALPAPVPVQSGQSSAPTTPLPALPSAPAGLAPLPPFTPAKPVPAVAPASLAAFDVADYSPSAADYARNWPVFRGPGLGSATGSFPTKWNGPEGEGVLWKTAISLPGWNSPVVWGDRVFLTGADSKSRTIYCVSADTGKLIWKQPLPALSKGPAPEVMSDTGYAAPTAATDGKRVFAIFPNGDLFAYSFSGKRLWSHSLGTPESQYGYAASLATFRSLVIVQFDQGTAEDGKSALIAFQGATGKIVWRVKRPVGGSWASPVVVRDGDSGIVLTNANPWTMAYDALTGHELWRANLMSGDVAPSPACAGGTAFFCNNGAVLAAVRLGGKGDVTKTHVAWQASDGLPDITSPAVAGSLLFLISTEGTLTCYDTQQGKKLWDHSLEASFKASPVIAGGLVYLQDADGVMHVIEAGRSFKSVVTCALGEKVNATPAFVGGRIYIRGEKHLFCIGGKQ